MEIEKEEPTRQEISTKMDKQFYWVLGIMVGVIVMTLSIFAFSQEETSFEHKGLKFQVEMLGEIPLYKHRYFTDKYVRTTAQVIRTDEQKAVNLILREDPRELDDIPVEGKIEYLPVERFVYVTVDSSDGLLCEYSTIAMHQISSFLVQNSYKVKGGIADEAAAEEQNVDYITCENRPNRMVISFESGEETKIVRDGNCYTIYVSDCEILPAAEKFVIQSILDAKDEKIEPIS